MGNCLVTVALNSKATPPETALRDGGCGVPPWDMRQKFVTCCWRKESRVLGGWAQMKEHSLRCWGDSQQVAPCL